MDNNKNKAKDIDARTFGEIYSQMTVNERRELFRQFFLKHICSSRQTMWNWTTGKVIPQPLIAESAAKVVGNLINKSVTARTLFPERQI